MICPDCGKKCNILNEIERESFRQFTGYNQLCDTCCEEWAEQLEIAETEWSMNRNKPI